MRVGLSKGFRNGFRKLQWRIAAWTALILLSVQIGGLFLFEHIGRSSALDEVRAPGHAMNLVTILPPATMPP